MKWSGVAGQRRERQRRRETAVSGGRPGCGLVNTRSRRGDDRATAAQRSRAGRQASSTATADLFQAEIIQSAREGGGSAGRSRFGGHASCASDALSPRRSRGAPSPLDLIEIRTYDWRVRRTAKPETARKDIALVEIDEYSLRNLEPNAGRWPWPRAVHSILLDYLNRAPAKVVAYDVDFAAADTRRGFDFGGSVISGAESDQELIDSAKTTGNLYMLADSTYEAQEGQGEPIPGRRLPHRRPRAARAQGRVPTVPGACRRRGRLRPQSVRARPGWSAAPHRAIRPDRRSPDLRRSASRVALRMSGIKPARREDRRQPPAHRRPRSAACLARVAAAQRRRRGSLISGA